MCDPPRTTVPPSVPEQPKPARASRSDKDMVLCEGSKALREKR